MQHRRSTPFRRYATLSLAPFALLLWGCSGPTGSAGDEPEIGQSFQELITSCPNPSSFTVILVGTAGADVLDASSAGGPACILGNGGNDTITGSGFADFIAGGDGNDTINAGAGDDIVHGETGDDTIHGNAGHDQLYGEQDNDTLFGDAGNDYIDGSYNNDILWGGDGDDTLYGQTEDDTLHGDEGTDHLFGGAGNDTLEGGNGNDVLQGDTGSDHLWGDFINNATATSGSVSDTLHGNDGDDDLHGGPGNDFLFGDIGIDSLNGDDGDDRLVGGSGGTKTLSGGNGNDLVKGNAGSDALTGDDNNDVLVIAGTANGGNGTDACSGTSCELGEPASSCAGNAQCATGQRCATEVGVCIYCQSDSECSSGACIPTVGCTSKEVICNDGLDDDGDGQIDCADTDCAQDVNCQTGVTRFGNGGVNHSCVTTSSGAVKCWGRDNCAQLGFGVASGTLGEANATAITGPLAATPNQVRGGTSHTCALLADGTVQCWGQNTLGQFGNGTTTTVCDPVPKTVSGLSGVTNLASAGNFNCAVTGGAVKCWGENNFGQIGNNSQGGFVTTPTSVQGLSGTVLEVAAGIQNACARLSTGAIKCWGRNHIGQVGDGSTALVRLTAVQVSGLTSNTAQIAGGRDFMCARRPGTGGGVVYCWGANYNSQLGNGQRDLTAIAHPTPVQVSGITDAIDLGTGWSHACIVRGSLNGMRCWGRNVEGQLGIGSTSPDIAKTSVFVNIYDGTNLGMGQNHTCVRRTSGGLYCWGDDQYGQIGNGTLGGVVTSPTAVANVP